MFLLITGASGVGKSTVRLRIQTELAPQVEAIELTSLTPMPETPDLRWRHQAIEKVVQYALELQHHGKHMLLAGDPVPPGELLAAPSAHKLEGVSILLLDVQPEAQRARLSARGDDEVYWIHHVAFAAWMREHVKDPQHMQVVIRQDGWEEMRWERWDTWAVGHPEWRFTQLDTTFKSVEQVAQAALEWCRDVLGLDHSSIG